SLIDGQALGGYELPEALRTAARVADTIGLAFDAASDEARETHPRYAERVYAEAVAAVIAGATAGDVPADPTAGLRAMQATHAVAIQNAALLRRIWEGRSSEFFVLLDHQMEDCAAIVDAAIDATLEEAERLTPQVAAVDWADPDAVHELARA